MTRDNMACYGFPHLNHIRITVWIYHYILFINSSFSQDKNIIINTYCLFVRVIQHDNFTNIRSNT